MTNKTILVGIGVIALNEKGQFIMGRRKNAHGAGGWALPGGKMEFGETFEACAKREVLEETGLSLTDVKTISVANHLFDDNTKHFVALYCIGRITGEPKVMEPEKTEEWQFINDWHDMPQPVFVDYRQEVDKADVERYKAY